MKKVRILIVGATGQVGGETIRELLDESNLQILGGTRAPNQAKNTFPKGVEPVHLDLDDRSSVRDALQGVERAMLLTGYTVDMLKQSKMFVDEAKQAGVQHMVHIGACGGNQTDVGHWAWHQLIERYIEWSGIAFTHLRPEWYMQNLLGYGGNGEITDSVIRQFVGDATISWVDHRDVAAVAAMSLRKPEIHAGKLYRLGYDAQSYFDIASILSEVTGKSFRYDPRPPSEFLEAMRIAGANMAYMRCVHDHYERYAAHDIPNADETFDNFSSIVGDRMPMNWHKFAKVHADQFFAC